MTAPTTSTFYRTLSFHGIKWAAKDYTWNRSIPHNYRIFLWLAFRGRLNTRDNMTAKHWTHDPHCDICPAIETIDHIILLCKPADNLWRKLGLTKEANSSQNMLQFLEKTTIGDKVFCKLWPICFAACAHTLWITRNN